MIKKIIDKISLLRMIRFSKTICPDIRCISGLVLGGNNIIYKKCEIRNVELGKYSYIGGNSRIINSRIGAFTSIGTNLRIVIGRHPISECISTHPLFYSPSSRFGEPYCVDRSFEEYKYIDNENQISVNIGNDCWIGDNVTIIEGVNVGNGVVIAAGSVVTKDVPDYAVVGGIPAQIIRYRFDKTIIDKLLDISWWNKDDKWIRENIDYLNSIIN